MVSAFGKIKEYILFFIISFFAFQGHCEDKLYTINFKNVAISEYLNFVSKICNTNFVYEEGDLNFNVTVVSEDEIEPGNVMATLIQILRIHGLTILEEDSNLVIHKNPEVKQLAKIVTENTSLDKAPPIITKVFRVKNAKIGSIASIIRPMISTEAILETSADTRQLIITDVTSNIKKIGDLIEIIDSPINPLEIEIYTVKENTPEYLINLTNQIMSPIAEGDPFILVPQDLSGSLFIISTPRLIDKAISVLSSIDIPAKPGVKKQIKPGNIFIYKLQHLTKDELQNALNQIVKTLESTGNIEINLIDIINSGKWISDSESFLFTGTDEGISKLKEILEKIDVPSESSIEAKKMAFFIYKPVVRKHSDLSQLLKELSKNLKSSKIADHKLISTLENVKEIDSTQSLLFTGDSETFAKIKELLSSLDVPEPRALKTLGKTTFYIYKIQHATSDNLINALKNTADNLKKADVEEVPLINAIKSVKFIPETNSLLFTGDAESLKRIDELLPSFDTDLLKHRTMPLASQFFVYKPEKRDIDDVAEALQEISKSLSEANLVNPAFMKTIDSMKVVESTNSLLFTGDSDSLKRIEELLKSIDTTLEGISLKQIIFLYQPKHASKEQMEKYLANISSHLDEKIPSNKHIKTTLENAKWIPESSSFLFTGTESTINQIKDFIDKFDTQEEILKLKDSYYLYKLKEAPGDVIVEDLENFADKLKTQNVKRPFLIEILETAKWVKETNSILLTGNPTDLQEAIEIVKEFDTPRALEEISSHSNYFIYKPKFADISFIEQSLRDTAINLEKARLADPNLLNAINSMRRIESTNTIAFTGTPEAIEKIKAMLTEIDVFGAGKDIRKLGETTFLVYKIEKAAPQKLMNAISNFAMDLKKSGTSDKDLIAALESMKYKPEINSLLFTGSTEALQKTRDFVSRLDSEDLSMPVESPAAYFVYKPRYLSGPALQEVMNNFASHLKLTGFENQNLFSCIQNSKWDDQTKSLLFSGNEYTISEVKGLLATFDVPSEEGKEIIQPIDETCFLVYKLQYHKGDSIQSALKQVATELSVSGTAVKKTLISAINSIQWIQVTNSLLCSGDRETMTRLKELINSLDVPLKQVFIEMLVLETTFTNILNFGLNWGGKYLHNSKFVAGVSNSPSQNTTPDIAPQFIQNLNALGLPPNVPQSSTLPTNTGFDLGIIGDIILHKGQSFLSLGSLVQALQEDQESSIIVTPKILAQDNKPSYLFIGQNIPYVGSQTTYQQQVQATTANLEYKDVGMEITITPVLGNSNTVTLDINLSRSTSSSTTVTTSQGGVTGITTDKTAMTTTVNIPDKCFLVLSGMGSDQKIKTKQGLPCLGGLPLIGAAFSQNNKNFNKTNIMIFIRPHIINSYKDMENVTENSEDFFRDTSGSPGLEADVDEGVDYIKTYYDE